ncbi:MAG: aldehyde dehydrogenase family protein, partial [Gemmataceae bacterium]|nr:aldehyde dehydrogenase family protein [Gemmataceae bacterium]
PNIEAALRDDLGKPAVEVLTGEVAVVAREIAAARRMLPRWTKPRRVGVPLFLWPAKAQVVPEPLGVVLIIAPWNYPLQLTLVPLIGALAAGNCAVVKPSELAPATSRLLAEQLPQYIADGSVQVIEGGPEQTTALLAEPFDHIFFTGNAAVGRLVMEAAAKHLTPVTLELGGKCPCLVDVKVDLDLVARRLTWAKFYNAGQTCIAPDYVLVHQAVESALLERLKRTITAFYGPDPTTSRDYGRIVNLRHFHRLTAWLRGGNGEVVCGGHADEATRYIAPTIVRNVPANAPVLTEEIFGPILPIVPVSDMTAAIEYVRSRPKPLALYLFSNDRALQRCVVAQTSSGSVVINHAVVQGVVPNLPFGGVGPSGTGAYHGKASFDTFSHYKSVLNKATWFDLSLAYPPYDDAKRKWLRRLV